MISFLLFFCLNTPSETALDQAARWMEEGNFLMAEAELLNADATQDPVRAGLLLFKIAVRTNSTIGKQQFVLTDLIHRDGWETASQLAALGLTEMHRDWESFVLVANPFLNSPKLANDPIRYRVLYHLARHTAFNGTQLILSPSEQHWFKACRDMPANRTWPADTESGWPFLFQHGYLLETQTPFTLPSAGPAPSFEDRYAANLFKVRHFLNKSDLDNAAGTINQLIAMDSETPPAYLKTFFYQLSLEYFQRKGLPEQAGKTASNLDAVRKRAFLPIQSWPETVLNARNQRTNLANQAASEQAEPEKSQPEPLTSQLEPAKEEKVRDPGLRSGETPPEPQPSKPETEQEARSDGETPPTADPAPQTVAPGTAAPTSEPEVAPPGTTTGEKAGDTSGTASQEMTEAAIEPTTVEDDPAPTIELEESQPNVSEPALPAEPEAAMDESTNETIPAPSQEPAFADPNLALAEALLNDGDLLMAEAQFMAVNPRHEDILPLGFQLAEIALRTNSVSNKTAFFQDHLKGADNWRGVALTILSVFAAHREDWAVFQEHASQLLREFGPFKAPESFRLIYYLARYSKAQPKQLRPVQALWFEKARTLSQYSVFPGVTEPSIPYEYRWAGLLDARQAFQVPAMPSPGDEDGNFLWHLLKIRTALNTGDLNQAAMEINQLKALPRKKVDYQWRHVFQQLNREYFEKRGDMDNAMVAGRNAGHYLQGTALPLVAFPERAAQITEWVSDEALVYREPALPKPEPEMEPVVATPETSAAPQPEPPPESSTTSLSVMDVPTETVTPGQDLDWEGYEKALQEGARDLELQIRGRETETTYERIYKAYLLGTIYLAKGRYQSAYERLALAENLVRELPFPVLESKVMLAMADYYDAERNQQQANWYRIAAIQLWNRPLNLPMFAAKMGSVRRSPFPEIIDQGLKSVTQKGSIHNLLYYSELEAFLALREKAYQRENLSANAVLSGQIKQVGSNLAAMIDSLATSANSDVTPRRYNDTQELWEGLWESSYSYFKQEQLPGLTAVQSQLLPGERLLVFIEGKDYFGALYITENQDFAVSLGNIASFRRMDQEAQFDFLEGRLGPVWNHTGGLTLKLSAHFQNQSFLTHLYQRMPNPDRLRFTTSLKSLVMRQSEVQTDCGPSLWLDTDDTLTFASEDTGSETVYHGSQITRSLLYQSTESFRRIYLSGTLTVTGKGLILEPETLNFNLSELPRYQPQLCSLTLIAPSGPTFLEMLDELAFLQIQSAPAIEIRPNWPAPEAMPPDFGLAFSPGEVAPEPAQE